VVGAWVAEKRVSLPETILITPHLPYCIQCFEWFGADKGNQMFNEGKLFGTLVIKMTVALPTNTPRAKRVILAKSWCIREDAEDLFNKWVSRNPLISHRLIRAEWTAQEMVFSGDEA